ncbi:hydrogenase nickel incorporation protein HypB [Collinsella sp. AGMB00827]|uniref:Hydrogenase nickel incorporation protein HypB n=1 Tax=Collinsella ureilytica TaxID=2869515 RepID=A0ABS7MJE4_9ACTN|nr:hydrogenase nickel incorporation protein HypB [Collinsella urealyticum]MBY4797491.1 hydrogenase nickel incorporation protein HypB [Collinsella urealyticum]
MGEKTVGIVRPILSANERIARELRERFSATNTFVVNVLSSPGSGKTSTILATNERLRDQYHLRCAVIEGDIASDVDAQTMKAAGIPAIQINTGGLCHLEGDMIRRAVDALDAGPGLSTIDVIFIENVGNLVCPVDFDLGEDLSVMILSIPEGDDKPLKYPGIFQHADALLLNKIDVRTAFDFDLDAYSATLDDLNPEAPQFSISAVRGSGMDAWCAWLAKRMFSVRS